MQKQFNEKRLKRERIKRRIRKKIQGTPERPRLVVFRSIRAISAQLVDDVSRKTLVTVTSLSKSLKEEITKAKGKTGAAEVVGRIIAEEARKKNIETVVFDRNGYLYHGRIKAVAEGARKAGLKF
ncbi:50S ribosomal protein L18 [bacterium]|nr:50S ribosomal protein L18 [bacterium]